MTIEYMILIHRDESFEAPAPGTPEFEAMMAPWLAYNQKLIDEGRWIAGANLLPSATATTVRKAAGGATVTDGPFAETKEQFGGFYVIAADDLDHAIELATAVPIPDGSIEVRPVGFRPDAA